MATLTSANANERGDDDGIGLTHRQQVLLNICTTMGATVSSEGHAEGSVAAPFKQAIKSAEDF